MASLTFTVVYLEDADGVTAYVEELPFASANGRTVEEADHELRKVVEIVIAANRRQAWESFKYSRVLHRATLTVECPK